MARLELDYGLEAGPLVLELDHRSAIGLRTPRPYDYVDSWHGCVGLRSVRLVLDDDADEITAPEFVDKPSLSRANFR